MQIGNRSARCAAAVILSAAGGVVALSGPRALARDDAALGGPEQPVLRTAGGPLKLRAGPITLDPARSLTARPASALRAGQRYIASFDGPMTPARHDALTAAGFRYEGYLPDNAAILRAGAGTNAAAVRKLDFVRWLGAYDSAWKLDADLARAPRRFETVERQRFEDIGVRAVVAYLFDDEPLAPFEDALRAVPGCTRLGSEIVGSTRSVFLTLPAAQLTALTRLAAVRFVEEMPEFTERNTTTRWIVQSNQPNITPLYDHGLTGAGQILGLIDTRLAAAHCSFTDPSVPISAANTPGLFPNHRKILAYNTTYGTDFHGTHVGGTAVGDGGAFNDTRGVAYAAKMVFAFFPSVNETSVYNSFFLHYSQGACVHNSSWGNNNTNTYDGTCRAIDNLSWLYDDNLLVFAICDNQSFPLIRNPENAKNCLAVSACGDSPNQSIWCSGSMGPTTDGRRKPEVMAPGCGIQSASGTTCNTAGQTGTSMAAPAASGAAILVRQYFTDGYFPSGAPVPADAFNPSGALLKAVLVNSAVDVTGVAGLPSAQEGWGRVLADNALYFPGDASKLLLRDVRNNSADALVTAQPITHYIYSNGPGLPLKITLAYHDAPATLPAASAPVNIVYLQVVGPDAQVYYGNNVTNGVSTPGGSPDLINNLQQVIIPAPDLGVWAVTIHPQAINVGAQGYALVATGDVHELCPSDFDHNGFVNGDDADAFAYAFYYGTPDADFDHNTFVNGDDADAFAWAFFDGC